MGVGWLREEFEALGVPWERRGARTDEYLEVLHTLWCETLRPSRASSTSWPRAARTPSPPDAPSAHPYRRGERRRPAPGGAAGPGWHTFNRPSSDLPGPSTRLGQFLARKPFAGELRVTVCPYFAGFDEADVVAYRSVGADAVAALFLPMGVDDVEPALDRLQPLIDAARSL